MKGGIAEGVIFGRRKQQRDAGRICRDGLVTKLFPRRAVGSADQTGIPTDPWVQVSKGTVVDSRGSFVQLPIKTYGGNFGG